MKNKYLKYNGYCIFVIIIFILLFFQVMIIVVVILVDLVWNLKVFVGILIVSIYIYSL